MVLCRVRAGFMQLSGPQFLQALLDAGVRDLWAIGVGCKMPWGTFASLYEGSLEPGAPVTIDLGKTRLRPGEDHLLLYRVPGGRRGLVPVVTEGHGRVQCRTYALCGTRSGTLHYSIKVCKAL